MKRKSVRQIGERGAANQYMCYIRETVMADYRVKLQIRKTIEEHMKKEKRLKNIEITALPFFFIEKVAKCR